LSNEKFVIARQGETASACDTIPLARKRSYVRVGLGHDAEEVKRVSAYHRRLWNG